MASGILKRRRLKVWNRRQATAYRPKGKLYTSVEWSYMGETFTTSPRGLYLIRQHETIPVLLHPTMPAICEVDYWTNNGKGRIALGVVLILLTWVLLFGLLH